MSSYLVITLSGLIMISSFIGLLGFQLLSNAIQGVLFNNFISFFAVIFLYQILLSFLEGVESKNISFGQFKLGLSLFIFLKVF